MLILNLYRDLQEREVSRPRDMPTGYARIHRDVRDEIGYQLSRDDYNVSRVGLGRANKPLGSSVIGWKLLRSLSYVSGSLYRSHCFALSSISVPLACLARRRRRRRRRCGYNFLLESKFH